MVKTSGFLRDNADRLRKQAAEQRRTSESDGDSRSPWQQMRDHQREIEDESRRQQAIADGLAPELQRVRGLSDAEQLAWWNSLSDDQRAALLAQRPGELTALGGLPADIRALAQENYTSQIAEEIQTSSSSIHGEAEISIKFFKIGGGFDVEQRVYHNGSVELEVSGFLKAGVGVDDLAALREAGLGGTFEFDSQAEADQFLKDLAIAAAKGDVVAFMKNSAAHLGSVEVTSGLELKAGVSGPGGGAEVGIDAEVSMSVDTKDEGKGDVTLSAQATVSGGANTSTLGVSGEVEIAASGDLRHDTEGDDLLDVVRERCHDRRVRRRGRGCGRGDALRNR